MRLQSYPTPLAPKPKACIKQGIGTMQVRAWNADVGNIHEQGAGYGRRALSIGIG